jgi:putative oxidoreductase
MTALDRLAPHAHWLLRIAILSVFLYHGLDKWGDLEGFAGMMEQPVIMAALIAFLETAGAILVLLGGFLRNWMTRLGALMIVPVMIGAIALVHWNQWHFMATETHPMGGMQFQVTLLLILLYLFIRGNRVGAIGTTEAERRTAGVRNA